MQLPWPAQQLISEIDDLFVRAGVQTDIQVQSDYAKYLVVRVSGLVEQVMREVVLVYTSSQASARVANHVGWRMGTFQNPNVDRILQLVGSFDRAFQITLEGSITTPERVSLGSVRAQRNSVAHGQPSSISLSQISQYYADVKSLLVKVAAVF